MKKLKVFWTVMLSSLIGGPSFGANPIITHLFTADPSAHVFEGRMWIYPSHDQDDATSYGSMDGHHVFSSDDLVTWTDHGQIMHTDDISWAKKAHLWAPDCAYKDGTYYYYYPVRDKENKNRIGVATSSSPAGPFTDSGSCIEGTDEIDPCCFIDDDGQAYLYWGGHTLRFAKLNDDMKSIGEITRVEPPNFYEGAWMHKRNGIYYLSYATGVQKPIVYCTSTSPTGPFTYRGVLMDAEVTGGATNHHSIVKYKGRWYIFYHNIALSDISCRRSVCVDYLYYNEDGTIQKVVQTEESVAPVPYNIALNKTATQSSTAYEAEAVRAVDGQTSSKQDDASVTCTDLEANAWWQVDLGTNYIVNDIDSFSNVRIVIDFFKPLLFCIFFMIYTLFFTTFFIISFLKSTVIFSYFFPYLFSFFSFLQHIIILNGKNRILASDKSLLGFHFDYLQTLIILRSLKAPFTQPLYVKGMSFSRCILHWLNGIPGQREI
jgi:hypothetical protein